MLQILHLCGFKIISGIRSSIQYEFSLNPSGLTHYCYQSAVLIQEGFINGIAGAGLSRDNYENRRFGGSHWLRGRG